MSYAEIGYKAYSESTGNKNFRGEEMPEWNALPQEIRDAWDAAVKAAIESYDLSEYPEYPDE